MRRKFTNDDFEQFISQNADQFRIYPSPDAWKGINKKLRKRKIKIFAFTFSTLILLSVSGFFLFNNYTSVSENTTSNNGVNIYKPTDFTDGNSKVVNKNVTSTFKNIPAVSINKNGITKVDAPLLATYSNEIITDDIFTTNQTNGFEKVGIATTNKLRFSANKLALPYQLFNHFTSQYPLLNKPSLNIVANKGEKDKTVQKSQTRLKLNKRNFEYQLFASPAISYRKLSENKSYLRNVLRFSQPYNYAGLYDVNNAVIHKPDLGLEFGALAKYRVTNRMKLRAGLQFNINRYSIKAFSYVPERATIALNNRFWVDSVSTIANYRNFNGGVSNWLQNFYFQVSAPVGIEYKLKGTKNNHFGVAASIQPTYLIGDRIYLITADYKNYARVPSLVRHWNVNTSLETFVSFKSGTTNWQIGPQVRYQLMSSFVTEYPVKENLFDFGIKVGVNINNK